MTRLLNRAENVNLNMNNPKTMHFRTACIMKPTATLGGYKIY